MKKWIGLACALMATPLAAQQPLRDFCADRPGLGTPACTVDPGHLQVEVGLGDWVHEAQPALRDDTIAAADIALRYGVGDTTELRLEWTAYGHFRERDMITGEVDRRHGSGDLTLGVKQNLRSPDGSGTSLALLPFVTLPVGRQPIGAGDWGAGILVPMGIDITETLSLALTPEVDAAVDQDGKGRHLSYSSVIGLQAKLSKAISVALEMQALRDRDPEEHTTQALAGLSIAYQPGERLQLDAGANAGLNHNSPDVELYFGVSRKF